MITEIKHIGKQYNKDATQCNIKRIMNSEYIETRWIIDFEKQMFLIKKQDTNTTII